MRPGHERFLALGSLLGLLCGAACTQAAPEEIPESVRYEPRPVVLVSVSTRWADRSLSITEGPPPPVTVGRPLTATVEDLRLGGSRSSPRLELVLVSDDDDRARIELELPAPSEPWVGLLTGDRVELALRHPPRHVATDQESPSLSLVRVGDGTGLHVLQGHSTLPPPFPPTLKVLRKAGRIGLFASSGRDMCLRMGERFAVTVRAGTDKLHTLLPGETVELELDARREARVELHDCVILRAEGCGADVAEQWSCQSVIAVRPRGDAPGREPNAGSSRAVGAAPGT